MSKTTIRRLFVGSLIALAGALVLLAGAGILAYASGCRELDNRERAQRLCAGPGRLTYEPPM